jgi:hypothetical protein
LNQLTSTKLPLIIKIKAAIDPPISAKEREDEEDDDEFDSTGKIEGIIVIDLNERISLSLIERLKIRKSLIEPEKISPLTSPFVPIRNVEEAEDDDDDDDDDDEIDKLTRLDANFDPSI